MPEGQDREWVKEAVAMCTHHTFGCNAIAKQDDGECDCPLRHLLALLLAEAQLHENKEVTTRVDEHSVMPSERATAALTETKEATVSLIHVSPEFDAGYSKGYAEGLDESAGDPRVERIEAGFRAIHAATNGEYSREDMVVMDALQCARDFAIRLVRREEHIRQLISERDAPSPAPAPVTPTAWREIASAPKDEDVLLLYQDGEGVQPGYWDDEHGWLAVETQNLTGGRIQPTHWMPLPAALPETSAIPHDQETKDVTTRMDRLSTSSDASRTAATDVAEGARSTTPHHGSDFAACGETQRFRYSEGHSAPLAWSDTRCDLREGHLGWHEGDAHGLRWYWNVHAHGILDRRDGG